MNVAIVGATGLIGRRVVAALLRRGDAVVALSRSGASGIGGAREVRWDPAAGPVPAGALAGADAIVNLAGASIGTRRWTARRKRELIESRVATTRGVVDAMAVADVPVLVNGSGIDLYGPRGDEVVDESSAPGAGFLAEMALAWEGEAARAREAGARVVAVRTAMVLAGEGGALGRLALATRLFAGGPIGGGRQWLPWIHIEDEVGLILLALDRPDIDGPLNACAPGQVRQRDAAAVLGRVLRRPSALPVPASAARLAMGEMAALVLDGQRAVPRVARDAGYEFAYPDLEPALREALGRPRTAGRER
ncbi:MAG: TIGR01777 family oxidoreductase [Thermoleophilia bacterium]